MDRLELTIKTTDNLLTIYAKVEAYTKELKAENERLREAAQDVLSAGRAYMKSHGQKFYEGQHNLGGIHPHLDKLEAALSPPPPEEEAGSGSEG